MGFCDEAVTVTLTGEEWFAVLVKFNDLLQGKNTDNAALFSRKGLKAYKEGRSKLESQILAASAPRGERGKPAKAVEAGVYLESYARKLKQAQQLLSVPRRTSEKD